MRQKRSVSFSRTNAPPKEQSPGHQHAVREAIAFGLVRARRRRYHVTAGKDNRIGYTGSTGNRFGHGQGASGATSYSPVVGNTPRTFHNHAAQRAGLPICYR
jgi:hypothetical protein